MAGSANFDFFFCYKEYITRNRSHVETHCAQVLSSSIRPFKGYRRKTGPHEAEADKRVAAVRGEVLPPPLSQLPGERVPLPLPALPISCCVAAKGMAGPGLGGAVRGGAGLFGFRCLKREKGVTQPV